MSVGAKFAAMSCGKSVRRTDSLDVSNDTKVAIIVLKMYKECSVTKSLEFAKSPSTRETEKVF